MRVTFLCRSLNFGGAERQLLLLAKGLAEKKHEICIVTFYPPEAQTSYDLPKAVKVVPLKKKGRWDVFGFLRSLYRIIKQERPDILHSYLTVPNLLTLFVKKAHSPAKIVWGLRASNMKLDNYDWLARLTHFLEIKFSHKADLIITNSKAGFNHACEVGYATDKMHVIHNGIDCDTFIFNQQEREEFRQELNLADDTTLIALVGRLDPMKGHTTFIKAAAILSKRDPKISFVCLGNGDQTYKNEQLEMARSLGIDQSISFLAGRKSVPYSAFDILCLPSSYGEGFSNVIGEAMACGVPCVATDVGDAKIAIGKEEFIAPPENVEKLVEALMGAIKINKEQRQALAVFNRERMLEKFSTNQMIDKTEALLFTPLD